jgi:hypothetical protein
LKEKEKKKKGETAQGFFPRAGQTHPAGYAALGFFWVLGAIKSCFKGQSLNFMST